MEQRGRDASEGRRLAAAAVLGVTWGCVVVAVVLEMWFRVLPPEDVPFYTNMVFHLFSLVGAVVVGAASAIVLAASRHPVGWALAIIGVGFAVSALGMMLTLVGYAHGGDALGVLGQSVSWLSAPATFVALAVLPWYLLEARPSGLRRVGLVVGTTCTVVLTVGVITDDQEALGNPLSVRETWVAPWLDIVLPVAVGLGLGTGVAALALMVAQGRAAPRGSRGRRGHAALALAFALIVGPMLVLQYVTREADVLGVLAVLAMFAGVLLFPFAVTVAVLRSWERPLLAAFPHVMLWLLLSTVVVAVYVLLVAAVGEVLPADDRYVRLLAVAVLALAVQPVRVWLQRRIDRLVYGSGSDPVSFLARLGEQLRGSHEAGGALSALVSSLCRGLRLGAVEVYSCSEGRVVARAGGDIIDAADRTLALPLVLEGRQLGELRLHAAPGQRLDPRTTRVAGHVTDLVAVSLDLAATNQRLREASERLGEVRHEERRMLRRELHDGMGPALAGVGLGLAAARRRLLHDPEGTDELLGELEAELARRTDDVRLLARSLLPGQLDDGDLPAALEVIAARFRESGMEVRVEAAESCQVETRHQIALYHVAAEALLNAHRHAGASAVSVRVVRSDTALTLEVTDDGVGIGTTPRRGVGLRSMRERADELGGRLEIGAGPAGRGTRVRMVLP